MITVTTTRINGNERINFSVYHKAQVDGHVNPQGVLVQNGEGTMDASRSGWYIVPEGVRSGGHVLYTRREEWGGATYDEAAAKAKTLASDAQAVERLANEPSGGWVAHRLRN